MAPVRNSQAHSGSDDHPFTSKAPNRLMSQSNRAALSKRSFAGTPRRKFALGSAVRMEGTIRAKNAALPAPAGETGLTRYLADIRRFPILRSGEDFMLANRWRELGDLDAAHKLVTSHLRLVAKVAMGYRGYGLPA
jgi:DNA-directed RNA polymerase sigma subunit (sigma70/sigma32)